MGPRSRRQQRSWRLLSLLGAAYVGVASARSGAPVVHGLGAARAERESRSAVGSVGVGSLITGKLRGGAKDAGSDHAADDNAPFTRMRLVVAAGTSSDPSLVEISAADAAAMDVEDGGHVTLRGRKQRRTTCVVVVQKTGLSAGEVRMSATSLANVGLAEGQDVIVAPEHELPEAERALLLPFASDLAAYDGTADSAFTDALSPYLKDNDRPLTVGDIIETFAGEGDDKQTVRTYADAAARRMNTLPHQQQHHCTRIDQPAAPSTLPRATLFAR